MAHILLAEDDLSMRQFLAVALRRAGHEVMVAGNGLEALKALEGEALYDLLLTDIVMPGMDGIELAQQASKLCPALKVMFITGFAAVALSGESRGHNQPRLLSKPFHLNDLITQVETLLAA